MSPQFQPVIAIHGGAGTILRSAMTPELERAYNAGLNAALERGWEVLQNAGGALDAVTVAVCELENNPLFNAGRGAVFTHDAKHELDASIMCGASGLAGSVAAVSNLKNPVLLARRVMEQTEHVMLVGAGAMEFARAQGCDFAPDDYFFTEFRYQQFQEAKKNDRVQLDHAGSENTNAALTANKFGTVGAVACDADGNLAAATSTGGMTNKKFGRVGDTPLIGAGTYADNRTCAVSCTGHGEYFMRGVTAYDVTCRMKYGRMNLTQAANATIEELRAGGEGGLIAVDAHGNVALPFNSEGMYRAWRTVEAQTCEIYGEE